MFVAFLCVSVTAINRYGKVTEFWIKVVSAPILILLSVPFAVVATPLYVLSVILLGVLWMFYPKIMEEANGEDAHLVFGSTTRETHGMFKTAEISLESPFQTCLGE